VHTFYASFLMKITVDTSSDVYMFYANFQLLMDIVGSA
jgi:hypothetical protein